MGDVVRLDDGEVWRLQRARVALLLHIPPADVDEMDERDIADVLAVHGANQQIEAEAMKRKK